MDGVLITDVHRNIEYGNPAFCTITGYSAEEVIGKNPRMLQSGHHDEAFYKTMWSSLARTGQWQGEIWNRRKNGEMYPEWENIVAIRDDAGSITNYVAIFSDISTLKHAERRFRHLAHHDMLTSLPNRLLFEDRLQQALAQGGTTLRDFSNSEGQPGYFQQQLKVYGRAGLPCPGCGRLVQLVRQGQRATYYCACCQR